MQATNSSPKVMPTGGKYAHLVGRIRKGTTMTSKRTGSGRLGTAAKKVAVSVAMTMGVTLGSVALVATPAHALPTNCSGITFPNNFTAWKCTSGTGTYRTWAKCLNLPTNTYVYRYGQWVGINKFSSVTCIRSSTRAEVVAASGVQRG